MHRYIRTEKDVFMVAVCKARGSGRLAQQLLVVSSATPFGQEGPRTSVHRVTGHGPKKEYGSWTKSTPSLAKSLLFDGASKPLGGAIFAVGCAVAIPTRRRYGDVIRGNKSTIGDSCASTKTSCFGGSGPRGSGREGSSKGRRRVPSSKSMRWCCRRIDNATRLTSAQRWGGLASDSVCRSRLSAPCGNGR
jgi:hypothetical protein